MPGTLTSYEQELKEAQAKPRQSWGEVVQYLDGWAWGVDIELNTVCLGKEDAVKAAIANPKLHCSITAIDQVIELEREIIKQESEADGRQPKLKRPGDFRSRPIGTVKHREANARRSSAGKRTAVYKA